MPDLGIPFEFVLFGFTLVGVAVFHHRTLRVSLIGLTAITLYKLFVTGFNTGPGVHGLFAHFSHEWVILSNLLLLLMGFALLADHFESSKLPELLPNSCRTIGRAALCCSRSYGFFRASLITLQAR